MQYQSMLLATTPIQSRIRQVIAVAEIPDTGWIELPGHIKRETLAIIPTQQQSVVQGATQNMKTVCRMNLFDAGRELPRKCVSSVGQSQMGDGFRVVGLHQYFLSLHYECAMHLRQ